MGKSTTKIERPHGQIAWLNGLYYTRYASGNVAMFVEHVEKMLKELRKLHDDTCRKDTLLDRLQGISDCLRTLGIEPLSVWLAGRIEEEDI